MWNPNMRELAERYTQDCEHPVREEVTSRLSVCHWEHLDLTASIMSWSDRDLVLFLFARINNYRFADLMDILKLGVDQRSSAIEELKWKRNFLERDFKWLSRSIDSWIERWFYPKEFGNLVLPMIRELDTVFDLLISNEELTLTHWFRCLLIHLSVDNAGLGLRPKNE